MSKSKAKGIKNTTATSDESNDVALSSKKGAVVIPESISILEKECTYLPELAKEINALIKDKTKHFTVEQIIEQGAHGILRICVSARFDDGSLGATSNELFPYLLGDRGKYKNNVVLSQEECMELRHSAKISVIRDKSFAKITRANLYVLQEDKNKFLERIATEYREQIKLMQTSDEFSPFLNEQHKNFAPELKLAVAAWLELFADEKAKRNKGVEALLKEWLKKNHFTLTTTQIKRIATVITPENRKEGGAKKT